MDHVIITDPSLSLPTELSDIIRGHPGMIPDEERSLLFQLAKQWTGQGCIVDAGVFLGASTRSFYEGLKAGGLDIQGRPIHTFELALATRTWEKQRSRPKHKTHNLRKVGVGRSFADEFFRFVGPMEDKVQIHLGDILCRQQFSDPVEILFLDVLKSPELTDHCTRLFYPNLIPGAYIIQQDYNQPSVPMIKVRHEQFTDRFEFVGNVRSSSVFRVKSTISAGEVEEALGRTLELPQMLELHAKAEARPHSEIRNFLMRCSRCVLHLRGGDTQAATRELQDIEKQYGHLRDESFRFSARVESELQTLRKRIGGSAEASADTGD